MSRSSKPKKSRFNSPQKLTLTQKGSLALSAAAASAAFSQSAFAANTPDNVKLTATAPLDTATNYSLNALPTTTNDMTFTNGTYGTTAFTLNSTALTPGTLNDLDATQTLTITGTKSITLNGGSNSVALNSADLFYVASGGTLNLNAPVVLTTAATAGNFDIVGTGNIGGIISGATFGFTKTGAGNLTLSGANTYTGDTTVSAGTLTVGDGTNGSITSSLSANSGGNVVVGNGAAKAVMTFNSGATSTVNAVNVGTSTGASALNILSGTLTSNAIDNDGTVGVIGSAAGGYGSLNVSGGTLTLPRLYFGIASSNSLGMGSISGNSTVTTNGAFPIILSRSGGATGGLTISGGTLNAKTGNGVFLGFQPSGVASLGRAELNVNGGLLDNTGTSVSYGYPSNGWTGTGVLNLNAGTLLTRSIVNNGGTSLLNFSGGTLKATTTGVTLAPTVTAAYVNGAYGSFNGGAVIDTNGVNVTAATNLLAPVGNGVSALAVTGGTGYIGAPYVSISGTGTGATAIANIDSSGNLTGITVTNPGVNYTGTPTYTLTGGGGSGAVIGAVSIAANTSGGLTKQNTGTLTLTGTNTYSGKTAIQNGVLSVSSLNKVSGGAASSSLGAPTTVANGTIDIGSAGNTGTLLYSGGGETTDRVINLAGAAGGATIDQSGAGLLKFTSANTATGAGIKTLTLQGSTAGSGEIAGAIVDNTTTNTTSLTKSGTDSWTLSGASTYTGATTVGGGTLTIGNGTTGSITSSTSPNTGGSVVVGNSAANAVLTVNSGTTSTVNTVNVGTGSGGAGELNLVSGTLTSNGVDGDGNNGTFGSNANSYGGLNVSGGTLNISRLYFAVTSPSAVGVGAISAGVVNTTGGFPVILSRNAGTGVLTVSGTGALNTPNANISVGFQGSGRAELNVNGGTINNLNHLVIYGAGGASQFTGTDVVNLNAGTLQTNGIVNTSGTSLLNFNGGTFKAGTFSGTVLPTVTAAYVNGAFSSFNGGAVIDTNGVNVTAATNMLAPVGNGVSALAVTGGTGYIGAPYVSISGTGTGATAIANIDPSGNLTGITVTNPGVNYTGTPTYTLTGGGGSGAVIGAVSIAANTSGGLTKQNTGTLTLTGTNTYSGKTTIIAGSLALGSTGTINNSPTITVGDTAAHSSANFDVSAVSGYTLGGAQTLAGFGSVTGNTATTSGSKVAPGNFATPTVGTLTFNNNLNLAAGSILNYAFGAPGNTGGTLSAGASNGVSSLTSVTGALTLPTVGSPITLNLANAGGLGNGTYDLIKYGSQTGFTASEFTVGASPLSSKIYTFTNNGTTKEIDLTISNSHVAQAVFSTTTPPPPGVTAGNYTAFSGTANPGNTSPSSTITLTGAPGARPAAYLNNITTNPASTGGPKQYVTIAGLTTNEQPQIVAISLQLRDGTNSNALQNPSSTELKDLIADLQANLTPASGITVEPFSTTTGITGSLQSSNPGAYSALIAGDVNYATHPFEIAFVDANPFTTSVNFGVDFSVDGSGAVLDNITNIQVNDIGVVPEPTSLGLLAVGAAGLFGRRKRKSRKLSDPWDDQYYGRRD